MNFLSQALNMQTNVTIIIPTYLTHDAVGENEEYIPGIKYQVLYLLHGGTGDDSDYINNTNIVRYAEENRIAVVMPCDYNMAYTDDPKGAAYFSYITEELPKVCAALFPISIKPEDSFVGGLSMGSHGAMKIAVTYPQRYAAALIMSGASFRPGVPIAVKAVNGRMDLETPQMTPKGIIRDLLDEEFIKDTLNDVYAVAERNAKTGQKLPKLYFRVGDSDHALYRTLLAEKDLRSWGYPTDLEVIPGYGHEWDLWELVLRNALKDWFPIKRQAVLPE